MRAVVSLLIAILFALPVVVSAASQDRFDLPQPYLDWERQYLKEYPDLQKVMDSMTEVTARQLKDPSQDILHNRVCAALAQRMALDMKLGSRDRKLAIVTDLLHNISKEERPYLLTDTEVLQRVTSMITQLRDSGQLRAPEVFWSDTTLFANPAIGANLSLIHHVTGALMAGEMLEALGGYSASDVGTVQAAIIGHSTGYWYFRKSIDDAAKRPDAWRIVYPEPQGSLAQIGHDADLISQFETESVIPQGSKWRTLAAKRWGAAGATEEAHVVYYVFQLLFDEARTEPGKALARVEWDKIRPGLVSLMGLEPGTDPIRALGVPKAFR